jgi:hemoglobin-like flavoprotein
MTAEQILRLRKSFSRVKRRADVAAFYFYHQLFELDPGLRPLFQTDVELQALKLTTMLDETLDLLDRPIELAATLREQAIRHSEYGVRPEQYSTVGTAMISMLEDVLGQEFTLETRQAWVALYHLISESMLRVAESRPAMRILAGAR